VPFVAATGAPVAGFNAIAVTPTPQNTFGSYEMELGNITLIMKGLFYNDTDAGVYLSGGLSVTAPTARDETVHITDYLGFTQFNNVDTQRVRDIHVHNQTWGLSPFLAGLYAPNDRFFAQSFLQFDLPLNDSRADFTETIPRFVNPSIPFVKLSDDPRANVINPPYTESRKVREQILMHMDLGAGYWLLRDPSRRWLTGFAPTAEIHYSTTLNNAGLGIFSPDPSVVAMPTGMRNAMGVPITTNTFPPTGPVVGNLRNRLDIVNLTLGGTFVLAERATLATAVALPLRQGDNRTFDWEFQVQFNYFFGAPNR
jgi:hypothetical protein